jgi:t-SNARE complex subunit (syntaxin)
MKTNKNLVQANENMEQASKLQKKSRKKYIIFTTIIILIVAVILGMIFILKD